MKETFDLIKSVLDAGKSIFDNLFTKKLTKEDVEAIIAKHHITEPRIIEKFFIVINENQDLTFTEKGQITIKNNGIDKLQLQQLFLQMLKKQMENQDELVWEDVKQEPLILEPQKTTIPSEQEMILKIKEKHKALYGE